jgi:hypothetical protein
MPAYSGPMCEILMCENEPIKCKDPKLFDIKDCYYNYLIPHYCPDLCGKCKKSSTTIRTSTKTSSKFCNASLSCANGGKFNKNLCICECKFLLKTIFLNKLKYNYKAIRATLD